MTMTQHTRSDPVAALARELGFGDRIAGWRLYPFQVFAGRVFGSIGLIVLLDLLGPGLPGMQPIVLLVLIAIPIGLLIHTLVRMGLTRRICLFCFEGGVIDYRVGGTPRAYGFAGNPLYERVTHVFRRGDIVRTDYELRLEDPGEGEWQLTGSRLVRPYVVDIVTAASANVRAAEFAEAIARGERVSFGTVSLDPDGVVLKGGRRIPFESVSSLRREREEWCLRYDEDETVRGSIEDTNDFRAFMDLVDTLRRGADAR